MNRVGVLVVAAVVAIGSCFGLVRYASGAKDRAVSAAEPVPVMIAMKDVPQGMPFSTAWNEGRLALSNIPRTLRPELQRSKQSQSITRQNLSTFTLKKVSR